MVASASGSASNRERGVIFVEVLLLTKKSCSLLDRGQLLRVGCALRGLAVSQVFSSRCQTPID